MKLRSRKLRYVFDRDITMAIAHVNLAYTRVKVCSDGFVSAPSRISTERLRGYLSHESISDF